MQIEIQRPISWVQYSINKQTFDTKDMSKEDIIQNIQQAKEIWDLVQQTYWQPSSVADFQLVSEFNETKKVLEKVQTLSEQKSVLLEAMKKALGTEAYEKMKEEVMSSDHFNKITLHSKAE